MSPALIRTLPWSLPLALMILWEIVCRVFSIQAFILPAPSAIAATTIELHAAIVQHALQTLFTTVVGFAIAVGFGLLLGIALGASKPIYDAMYPMMVGFNSVPKVAIVPILVIWFGIGTVPAIITAFLISFFPIVVNVATGLATIEPELQDVLRSLGASKLQIIWKVGVPRAMPFFFAALKVAITLAFVGSVISETVASNSGVGYLMMAANANLNVPLVFAGLVVLAFLGVALYEVFAFLERRITFWATRANDIVG